MNTLTERIDRWLAAREAAGWFDGEPARHELRAMLRVLRRQRFNDDSPPTRGVLLALAREAWSDPYVTGSVASGWDFGAGRRATEIDALLATLEAAP